jgi:hypothetical protein
MGLFGFVDRMAALIDYKKFQLTSLHFKTILVDVLSFKERKFPLNHGGI